ncbi:MAG TPA: helix-turn-helix domain-containing protein [Gemmataceae bacterium]|nr:helix-turn-helix domain-containing protein [Gemmataceae bacterium]
MYNESLDPPKPTPVAREQNSESLLIPDTEVAALCHCSRSHWHTLSAAGKVPPSVKLGRKRLWRRAEIEAWINAGCPDASTWAAMQASAARRQK